MQRLLIILGLVILLVGLAWPWLSKLGLGKLPGDIHFQKDGFHFYFPLTTSILVGIVISVVIWLFKR